MLKFNSYVVKARRNKTPIYSEKYLVHKYIKEDAKRENLSWTKEKELLDKWWIKYC